MKFVLFGLNGRGGMLHYTSQYANALAKKAEVHVIIPSYSDTSLFNKEVNLIKISAPPTVLGTALNSTNLFQHLRLIKKIKSINPNVIQVMDNHPWYLFYLQKLKDYTLWITQHDPKLHSGEAGSFRFKIIDSVNKFLRDRANKIIVHGDNLKKILIELKVSEDKIIVVPHGDYSFFTKFSREVIQVEPHTILFFGRIIQYKGIDTLLKAVPSIVKEIHDLKVIIAGEGDFSPYQKYLTPEIGKYVELINRYIPESEVAELFQKCAFVVLPYDEATQSGIIPIAYSFRKPVIATRVGSIPEVIDESTGILISPKNSEELSKAILSMFHKDLKEMGENGYEKMKEIMDWDKIAEEIYKKAYNGK